MLVSNFRGAQHMDRMVDTAKLRTEIKRTSEEIADLKIQLSAIDGTATRPVLINLLRRRATQIHADYIQETNISSTKEGAT